MNKNTATDAVLHPHPVLGKRDERGNHLVLVPTEPRQGYLSLPDMLDLVQEGLIRLTNVDSGGLHGQYGRTEISYIIL